MASLSVIIETNVYKQIPHPRRRGIAHAAGGTLNSKRLLRFYFSADRLNGALDNLILRFALGAYRENRGCAYSAEKITALIGVKTRLSLLWESLDCTLSSFSSPDRAVLEKYALLRTGVSRLGEEERRAVHRVVVRFSRRFQPRYSRVADGVKLVDEYYALL